MVKIGHTVRRIEVGGIDPIEEFLLTLEKKDYKKVSKILNQFYKSGLGIGYPYVEPLQNCELWAIRAKHRRNQYRILFFEHENYLILLHGFQYKDEYQTKEIEIAESRMNDLLEELED